MTFTEADLTNKKVAELRAILVQRGASFDSAEKKPELISRIMELNVALQPNEKTEEVKPVVPVKADHPWLTANQVMAATEPHREAGLQVTFSDNNKCWHFSFDKGEVRDQTTKQMIRRIVRDSGSMKQPLEVVRRCAEMLAKPIRVISPAAA